MMLTNEDATLGAANTRNNLSLEQAASEDAEIAVEGSRYSHF